ncbi:uncharacterized protein LOC144870624 [Branchiostoma floridae x Branchiostoma japonicum]
MEFEVSSSGRLSSLLRPRTEKDGAKKKLRSWRQEEGGDIAIGGHKEDEDDRAGVNEVFTGRYQRCTFVNLCRVPACFVSNGAVPEKQRRRDAAVHSLRRDSRSVSGCWDDSVFVGAARPDEEVSQAPCVADDLVVEEKMYFEHDKPCRGNDLETTARRTTLVHVGGADFNYTASRAVVSCHYMKQVPPETTSARSSTNSRLMRMRDEESWVTRDLSTLGATK